MGGLKLQKRLASEILKVGETKVWIDPSHLEDVKKAIKRSDIRKMINYGYIKAKREKIRVKTEKKKKQGPGSKKGKKGARTPKKRSWMTTIRPLRKMLKELKEGGKIDTKTYRKLYYQIKSGAFRNRSHFKLYLKQRGIISEDGT
ncbi:MAG: 50S ribosomal protein L19e [Candidatus Aenigmatarchaeota archaeon]